MYINSTQRDKILISFGKHLTYLRRQSGLSQEDVGNLLSVPASVISRYERGKGNPTLITIMKLAEVLKVDVKNIVKNGLAELDNNNT